MKNVDAQLNSFASRCFRDVADRDYISARMCYRAGLISQFHWASLQAFEKYFKAILLYNRIEAKKVRHDLGLAQSLAEKAPFDIRLGDRSKKFIEHLDTYGRFRYLESSYFTHGPKLGELDQAVWELRRYCRVMNYSIKVDGKDLPMLEPEIERNEDAEKNPRQSFQITGGSLEKILEDKFNPARKPLIWQNCFFGKSHRSSVRIPVHHYAENSPLFLYPEILDHVTEYVFLPKEVINACREAQKKGPEEESDLVFEALLNADDSCASSSPTHR